MLEGVGPKTIEALWVKMGGGFDSRDPAQRAALVAAVKPAARGQWQTIDTLFAEYHAEQLSTKGAEAIERFYERFYQTHLYRAYENADKREDDLHELALQVAEVECRG